MDQFIAKITRQLHQRLVQLRNNIPARNWIDVFHRHDISTFIIVALLTLVCMTLVLAVVQYRGKINLREQLGMASRLSAQLRSSDSMDDNFSYALTVASEIVSAPYYAFYIWDSRTTCFVLRAASHPYDSFQGVGPAYSGLALPKKEVYLPPSVVEMSNFEDALSLVNVGDVPLLMLCIGNSQGLIRIGPINRVNRRQRRLLREFAQLLIGPLQDQINLEKNRLELELKSLSDTAVNKIAALAGNTMGSIDILLQAFTGIVGGVGGIFIERTRTGELTCHAPEELSEMIQALTAEPSSLQHVVTMYGNADERTISRGDPELYDFPIPITSRGDIGAIVVVPFEENGTLLMLQNIDFDPLVWRKTTSRQLGFLRNQVNRMTEQIPVQKAFTKGYTRLLCQIADFIDNLNPFTVGYSDMMTHYALAIGHQMNLSVLEMNDLALAARLSNIGVIGMDTKLLVKEGRYTDFEYNVMKRHCEISASMIELVTGNRLAAQYVLHHHERVDGNGYPAGLSAENIPIPSRILHVAQMFLAKVNGRSWRTPLSFESAMNELRSSADISLDGSVVAAFEQWWVDQAAKPGRGSGNIGFCYEMCCVPKSICEACTAFKNPTRCWEMLDNQCRFHGRECSTCFVKTEYQYRMQGV